MVYLVVSLCDLQGAKFGCEYTGGCQKRHVARSIFDVAMLSMSSPSESRCTKCTFITIQYEDFLSAPLEDISSNSYYCCQCWRKCRQNLVASLTMSKAWVLQSFKTWGDIWLGIFISGNYPPAWYHSVREPSVKHFYPVWKFTLWGSRVFLSMLPPWRAP